MISPLILARTCRGEVQCQKLFEEQWAQPLFDARHEPNDFQQHSDKFGCVIQELGEFGGDACFFLGLQHQQRVLLAGEVEEGGSVRNARGGDDGIHICACHTRALELVDRGGEHAFPCQPPPHVACRGLDLWRHGLSFVARLLTTVNECSHLNE